ncbi:fumarylacetoacetate hydrolase family protein [Motilimonas cestriensis]|uniref:Fumarylacetoacetate hydrolase family protein n=1 Tax=Motilimonas cestriensis TaxID=2742685 RepID=A0ABS8WCU7_9GAMM|nr:fumarylacetoacetate hydrolase family protein [Motilimonas cestriensis]MCE2595369.1 fumarylacetoacetate hydrolase family protein [Motilimonas cestriensis]
MKLASLNDGSRYGRLVVVSQDLRRAKFVGILAPNLPAAMDDWDTVAPLLHMIYHELNQGPISGSFELMLSQCIAPLTQPFEHFHAFNYRPYLQLLNQFSATALQDQLPIISMPSQILAGAHEDVQVAATDALDFSAQIGVITGPIATGESADDCLDLVRLISLQNQYYSPELLKKELQLGWGIRQSMRKMVSAPILVTPDELGEYWHQGLMSLPIITKLNGKPFAALNPKQDAICPFGELLAKVVEFSPLSAGAMISVGPVMNQSQLTGPANLWSRAMAGKASDPATAYLKGDDKIEMYVQDSAGRNLFGGIKQYIRFSE